MIKKRNIVIGDIHGCYESLLELLAVLKPKSDDRIICLGDVLGKGPQSREVLDWVIGTSNVESIIGNMEDDLIRAEMNNDRPERISVEAVMDELGSDLNDYAAEISGWPYYIELDDYDIVHAGIRAGIPLEEQSLSDLTTLRFLVNGRNDKFFGKAWYEFYSGPRKIIFGHMVFKQPFESKFCLGLDTGCVYGGNLSAFILDGAIIKVPARKAYKEWPVTVMEGGPQRERK
jgi:Calcineurin-like phosphoesterase